MADLFTDAIEAANDERLKLRAEVARLTRELVEARIEIDQLTGERNALRVQLKLKEKTSS